MSHLIDPHKSLMKTSSLRLHHAVTLTAMVTCFLFSCRAHADIETDYDTLTAAVQGQTTSVGGSPGSVAMFGKTAFPILLESGSYQRAAMAAGRYGDSYDPSAARAVAYSHTGFFDTSGNVNTTLLSNAILWVSRKAVPAGTTVAIGSSAVSSTYLTGLGYTTRSVGTSLTATNLSGVDVLVLNMHSGYTASAITNIRNFAAAGGGIVVCSTPWALSSQAFADGNAILDPFGLVFNGNGAEATYGAIPATSYSPYYSALNGTDDLLLDKEGSITMTVSNKVIASNAIDQVLEVRKDIATLNADLDVLSDAAHYNWITPTAAAPIARASKPVEAMLARYQSNKFDAMTTAQLFAHPCANDFPGAPAVGSTVTRTVSINGNTASDAYMNQGNKPVRMETGVYAAPGATITVTIPANKIANGLQVHIAPNGSEDQTWGIANWTFFPKLWRRVPLTVTSTQTGSVFGGLVTILVPAGSNLGTFDITVSGALPAPAFVMGQNTDAEWNTTLKNNPAPYGFLKTDKITVYVPKSQLVLMENPEAVAAYWKTVMDTADEYYGYTTWRKRGEAIASARYVAAGAAYAGYPIEAGWGTGNDEFLNNARLNGSWGNYHELGHGFQDNFDGAFVIPTHAEVDVNLFPGMIYTMVHDRTAWDGPTHSTYDASNRSSDRASFLALTAAEQTWAEACGRTMAYDFYFNLSEAFGWQAYKTAFTRLMNYLQNPSGSTDTVLKNLNSGDANFKRNRFYILMCDATGRNLDAYFQRYGLGVAGKGYEITQSVKDQIAAKNYPVWSDNTAVDSLSNPGTLNVDEVTAPGVELYQFTATDGEEPGTIWDYSITAGNTNNAFRIDKRTGKLRVNQLDAEAVTSYNLTVTVQDNGVPRFARTSTFTVNVLNVPEAPKVDGKLFTATNAMANGTSLGNVTSVLEAGRAVSSYAIVAGNDGHFAITSAGSVTVSNAATLPNPGVIVLTVKVTDSVGQTGYGNVSVLCNTTTGIYDERWVTQQMSGSPSSTGIRTSFNMPTNVASNFVRRVSGWVVPPKSGGYTFWIASDDSSTLFLSSDRSAANKVPIASVSDYTSAQQWTKYSSQQSAVIILEAGKPYYIEAIHYEGGGSDHLAVAWSGPGINQQVIPGANLMPNVTNITVTQPASQAPIIALTAPTNNESMVVHGTYNITASVTENANTIAKVEFLDGVTLLGTDYTAPFSFGWANPTPGPHTLKARVHYQSGTSDSIEVSVQVVLVGPPLVTITSPNVNTTNIPSGTGVVLEATVLDDTPATLTSQWSKVSGPGTVTFGNAANASTTATFSVAGTYLLRLTASDGTVQSTDEVTIILAPPTPAWNAVSTNYGTVNSSSYNFNAGTNTYTITGASAGIDNLSTSDHFQCYGQSFDGDFDFKVQVSGSNVSGAMNECLGAIVRSGSSANGVSAFVGFDTTPTRWAYWITRATTGAANVRTTPNTNWISATSWVRMVRSGTTVTGYYGANGTTWSQAGTTTISGTVFAGMCWSSDSSSTSGTATFTNFALTGTSLVENVGALVHAGTDQSIAAPVQATLEGIVSDDGKPIPPGNYTIKWSKVSGPGTVTFADASAPNTTATLSGVGTFVLRLTADDGEVKTFDDVIITATGPTVTIVATDSNAAEHGSDTGAFTVSRTGATTAALTVNLTRSGTATNGSDYQSLASNVTIPIGAASATVTITPLADTLAEGDETVTLSVATDLVYAVGSPGSAMVTIIDLPVDAWRMTQFGSDANNANLAGDTADFDGDGLKNLVEYAMGLNPKTTNAPSMAAVEAGMLTLTFTRNLAATDVTLTPRWSMDFGFWSTAGVTEEALGEVGSIRTIKAKVPVGMDTRKFLRLQVTRP